jgi:2-haloacid dehalogenase
MPRPSVVVFDVNETLSDMAGMQSRFVDVGAPASLASLWFASVLRDGFALTAAGSSARFAELGADLLRTLLPEAGVSGDLDEAVAHVLDGFSALSPHPDVVPGVRALHEAGQRLVTLSNGAASVAEGLLGRAGVRDLFEHVLSVEEPQVWKPAAAAYAFAAARCRVAPEQMLLVAVHPWDLDGASRAGLHTAWLNRSGRPYPSYTLPPTLTVSSLDELAGAILAQ